MVSVIYLEALEWLYLRYVRRLRCEYIMYRGLYRTAYARVSRSTITDTELQIGQFVVPRYGKPVTNDTHEARYLRSWKEDLPKEHVRLSSDHLSFQPALR